VEQSILHSNDPGNGEQEKNTHHQSDSQSQSARTFLLLRRQFARDDGYENTISNTAKVAKLTKEATVNSVSKSCAKCISIFYLLV